MTALLEELVPPKQKHVVIVGAGMAGLTCARELILKHNNTTIDAPLRVTIVEASNVAGGRIRADTTFVPGHVFDLGAEFVHGKGTLLTELITELRANGTWKEDEKDENDDDFYEEIFITSHADGGPDETPTATGKYGMYYVGGKLLMYDDPSLHELHAALEEILEETVTDPNRSFQDALENRQPPLSPELYALAVASYGNTAACGNLRDLSLSMIIAFEKHWEENEIEGDYRLPSNIGMQGVVQGLLDMLLVSPNLELEVSWQVDQIVQNEHGVEITSVTGDVIHADTCVITVPPPVLTKIKVDLSPAKQQALSFIGFERVMKVCAKFSSRPWPEELQSMVCADGEPIPEIWFREFATTPSSNDDENDINNYNSDGQAVHVAVGYLTAQAADAFLESITTQDDDNNEKKNDELDDETSPSQALEKATNILLQQLSRVLVVPVAQLRGIHTESLMYDWNDCQYASTIQGGYVYPKKGSCKQTWQALAEPDGRLFWAGEATNTNACCTIQAAMETGQRAAQQVREFTFGE
jgi:predicted NAD/FAD-dependent oxidoreductase